MSIPRQFRQDEQIPHGTNAQSNLKMTDIMPVQHEDLASNVNQMKKINIGQCLCEPYAVCNSNDPENGAYVADCVNFPDFALSFTDKQGTSHALVGLKVRVLFTHGITYGSVNDNTYPTLNINNSGAIPLLAQGKTMGAGAISAGQTVEFTVIPYGNGLAFDADSNVREANSDYVIYTDGSITYNGKIKTYEASLGVNTVTLDLSADFSSIQNVFATPRCGGYVYVNGVLKRGNPICTWRYSNTNTAIYFHILYVLDDGTVFEPTTEQDTVAWEITVIGK